VLLLCMPRCQHPFVTVSPFLSSPLPLLLLTSHSPHLSLSPLSSLTISLQLPYSRMSIAGALVVLERILEVSSDPLLGSDDGEPCREGDSSFTNDSDSSFTKLLGLSSRPSVRNCFRSPT
jgi:hypothetical protein